MAVIRPRTTPSLLFATENGTIIDYDGLYMAGSAAGHFSRPLPDDLIELPPGSELFALPGRLPVGIESKSNEPALLADDPFSPGRPIQAVAAFMAPAHTAIYTAAFQKAADNVPILPLFAYTAVGWSGGRF
jgi:hypothetical protein